MPPLVERLVRVVAERPLMPLLERLVWPLRRRFPLPLSLLLLSLPLPLLLSLLLPLPLLPLLV